jgi:hypothetical protein
LGSFACFDNACICPIILASGLACSSCLATVDADPTDAVTLGSFYSACKTGSGPIITPDPCATECSNVGSAYLTCTDSACFCPIILGGGLACSSCLVAMDTDPTDAAVIGSAYIDCHGVVTSTQHETTATHVIITSSTSAPTFTTEATSSTQESSSSTQEISSTNTSISKSSARGFAVEVFGGGNIQMIMFIAMVAGLFSVFF